jgi:hypothetical protein
MFTDAKWAAFDQYRTQYKLISSWSIYEIDNIDAMSGITAERLVYKNHWGSSPAIIELGKGEKTWGELWHAADKAIRQSGDEHHIFIESLAVNFDGDLELDTGS